MATKKNGDSHDAYLAGPDSLAAKIERENRVAHECELAARAQIIERADWAVQVGILRANEAAGAEKVAAEERLDALETAIAAFEDHRISVEALTRAIEEVAS